MIFAQPGATFASRTDGFPSGLAGTIGVRILDAAGATVTPRTTLNIIENPAGSGSYLASLAAPETAGSYSVFWDDGTVSPSSTSAEDLLVTTGASVPLVADWVPAVADVGALLRVRTKDANGNELGTFTTATRPTGDEVEAMIVQATAKVTEKLGTDIPGAAYASARETIALRAAMLVELSFFGDQITANRSPYSELQALYTQSLADLIGNVEAIEAAEGDEDPLAPAVLPSFAFPVIGDQAHARGSELPNDFDRLIW